VTDHLVFVPGVGGRDWLWEHQIKNLADVASSEVVVLDRQATRAEMADHVLAVAPQRFSIAGHSLGGWVAQEIAARAPERVSKLFLCDTLVRKPEGTDEYRRNYWTHAERDLDGALTEHFHLLLHQDRYADEDPDGQSRRP
jgi:pimeloyl-ACP methyl ester carboxylesterase